MRGLYPKEYVDSTYEIDFEELYKKSQEAETPYLFFNAWNEWSESAYLEPDKQNGYSHLEIIRNTIS